MNREVKPILLVLAGVAVLLLVFLALKSGYTETVILPSVDLPPPSGVGPTGTPIAVVMSMHEDRETSFFGLRRGQTHHIVGVQFYAPPDCAELLADGELWPTPAIECSTEVPITGVVTGTGIAATGETIVVVDAEISQECFNVTYPGDFWPSEAPECVETESD